MRFFSALQGIDFDKALKKGRKHQPPTHSEKKKKSESEEEEGMFKSPEYYAKMTPEERQAETDRMMGILVPWARGAIDGKARLENQGMKVVK